MESLESAGTAPARVRQVDADTVGDVTGPGTHDVDGVRELNGLEDVVGNDDCCPRILVE